MHDRAPAVLQLSPPGAATTRYPVMGLCPMKVGLDHETSAAPDLLRAVTLLGGAAWAVYLIFNTLNGKLIQSSVKSLPLVQARP